MFKKTIKRCAEFDLRNYSPEALRRIKKISMCAILIIPSDAQQEWYDAFSDINVTMCAEIIRLGRNETVKNINGIGIIDDASDSENSHFFVNGIAIIETKEKCPSVSVNGICIKRESTVFNQKNINGKTFVMGDDTPYKIYSNKVSIDYGTVNNCNEGTLVIAGGDITIENDVTEEMLLKKKLGFVTGKDIICAGSVYGYVNANSQFGNRIIKR